MALLPENRAGGQSGHIADSNQAYKKLNGLVYDAVADGGCVPDGSTDNTSALNTAYQALVASGGGVLWLREGSYRYNGALAWDSNLVSVFGAGAGCVTLIPGGSGSIELRPSSFTVVQGPRFGGFTIDGSSNTDGHGIDLGDIIGAGFDDLVVRDFTAGVGLAFDNLEGWTERNAFGRVWVDNCLVGVRCAHTGGGASDTHSYGYNRFLDLRINVYDGQTAWQMVDDVFFYSSTLVLTCNVEDAGTVFDLQDTSQFQGVLFGVGAEQTSGAGGVGRKVASGAHCWGVGYTRFDGLDDDFDGVPRHGAAWNIAGSEALPALAESEIHGQIANWLGTGNAANLHPVVYDAIADPYAVLGFATGTAIRSPFLTMFKTQGNALAVAVINTNGTIESMEHVARVATLGELEFPLNHVPTFTADANLGSSLPTPHKDTLGNCTAGTIAFASGSGPTNGVIAHVAWAFPRRQTGKVFLAPKTGASWGLEAIAVNEDENGFDIQVGVAPAASQPLYTYIFDYFVVSFGT